MEGDNTYCCGILKRRNNQNNSEMDTNRTTSDGQSLCKNLNGAHICIDDDQYKMDHCNRGTAVVFNHYKFDVPSLNNRSGTEIDVIQLKRVLTDLAFDVQIYNDLKYEDIYDIIQSLAKKDHSSSDCLMIIVLTHGDTGILYAKDHQYPPDTLWMPFAGNLCPTLAGKPKIFFVQACRGMSVDSGVRLLSNQFMRADTRVSYVLPAMADFLIMYATYDGYYSWRNSSSGSWFIQTLCEKLKKHAKEKDLMAILTLVNKDMAIYYHSYVPNNEYLHQKKQIGTIVSTLTRTLSFYDKNV